jgi:transcriptional regulator with XRE-family HTH domain
MRGLTRKDLERYIGPRCSVSDILNRVRPLTPDLIRRLSSSLGLPASVLIKDYPFRREAPSLSGKGAWLGSDNAAEQVNGGAACKASRAGFSGWRLV